MTNSMEKLCAYVVQNNDGVQMKDEKNIYESPCNDDGDDYIPIYAEPPKAVEQIYELFENKRFCKLNHKNIRYHKCVCTISY